MVSWPGFLAGRAEEIADNVIADQPLRYSRADTDRDDSCEDEVSGLARSICGVRRSR